MKPRTPGGKVPRSDFLSVAALVPGMVDEIIAPAQPRDSSQAERAKEAIANVLDPLEPDARARVMDAVMAKLLEGDRQLEESVLAQAVPTSGHNTVTPARRRVLLEVLETFMEDPLRPSVVKAALARMTAVERSQFLGNWLEEARKEGGEVRERALRNIIDSMPGVPSRADRAIAALDEAIADHPSARERLTAQRANILAKLDGLQNMLRTEADCFIRFCNSVRGYELGPEPGAHMMALGRLFVGEDETAATELAELLGAIEHTAKSVGWERFAPNAKACFEYLRSRCDGEFGSVEVLFARRWARSGFPVVEMGHRTAASLMFTHGSGEVESPWPAFMIKVPDGLVVIESEAPVTLARVLCLAPSEQVPHWSLLLHWRQGSTPHALYVPMKTLDGELTEPIEWSVLECGAGLRRAIEVTGRLVAGACMLATAKQGIETRPWQPRAKTERRRTPGVEPPAGTRFIVTKNVELDLREQVHEYVAGRSRTGGKLTVQFVVRGHRRWQACGPRHSERKLIWINPFWKGPEEGRALVRGYELRGPGDGSEMKRGAADAGGSEPGDRADV